MEFTCGDCQKGMNNEYVYDSGDIVCFGCLEIRETQTKQAWKEYDMAAEWCAKRGLEGKDGDPLPENLGAPCAGLISEDPDAFQQRVKDTAYAMARGENLRDYKVTL